MTEPTDGNAPLIPRSKLIEILNELQLTTTKILIVLDQYAPEHFKETETRQPKVVEPVWASTGTGQPEQSVVHTVTGG